MSFCNILAVGVCITQMAHQGAILAQRPAERDLGYLHVNLRSPKLLPWDVPEDGHQGPTAPFLSSFFFSFFPFSFVILYHTHTTDDLPEFHFPSLGALLGSCRPVFLSLG